MRSPYNFILTPFGSEYNNSNENGIVVNATIEDSKFVNRIAIVVEVPLNYSGLIQKGDKVVIHHNVFRTYLDMKGNKKKSREFFRDDLYIVDPSRIYLYNNGDGWNSHLDYCFIRPIKKIQHSEIYNPGNEEDHIGEVVFSNKYLSSNGINIGDRIGFTKNSE